MIDAAAVWLKDNKDGVVALAALLSPATALVAALVSYRAVITGPRIQREIAEQQSVSSNRQIELQQQSLTLAARQLEANLLGSSKQKWIDEFRDALADLTGLVSERLPIIHSRNQNPGTILQSDRLLELVNRAIFLINKIRLLLGSPDTRSHAFIRELRKWLFVDDMKESAEMGERIFVTAVAIIEERKTRIASLTFLR